MHRSSASLDKMYFVSCVELLKYLHTCANGQIQRSTTNYLMRKLSLSTLATYHLHHLHCFAVLEYYPVLCSFDCHFLSRPTGKLERSDKCSDVSNHVRYKSIFADSILDRSGVLKIRVQMCFLFCEKRSNFLTLKIKCYTLQYLRQNLF